MAGVPVPPLCKRKGHYGSQCLSKTTAASADGVELNSETESSSQDDTFLSAVGTDQDTAWLTDIQLKKKKIPFKLDTSAEVTVISEEVYHSSFKSVKLQKPIRTLYGPARQPLQCKGQFSGKLKRGKRSYYDTIYVVKSLHRNLLNLHLQSISSYPKFSKVLEHLEATTPSN